MSGSHPFLFALLFSIIITGAMTVLILVFERAATMLSRRKARRNAQAGSGEANSANEDGQVREWPKAV
jgi:hypothetical protein